MESKLCTSCELQKTCKNELRSISTYVCLHKLSTQLYKYLRNFEKKSNVQPYRDMSFTFDPAWRNYVAEVEEIFIKYARVIKRLYSAHKHIDTLPIATFKKLFELYTEILKVDAKTPDIVFETNKVEEERNG